MAVTSAMAVRGAMAVISPMAVMGAMAAMGVMVVSGVTAVSGVMAVTRATAVAGNKAVSEIPAIPGITDFCCTALAHANAPPWLSQANRSGQAAGSEAGRSSDSPGTAPLLVPLQCRLAAGPWRNCNMRVDRLGEHWWLELGGRLIEFRHDGQGGLAMRWPGGPWRPVNSRWQSDGCLCWDGICARGNIPLD